MAGFNEKHGPGEFIVSAAHGGRMSLSNAVLSSGENLQAGAVLAKVGGEYVELAPGANDDSGVAAAILFAGVDASAGARSCVVVARLAEVDGNGLLWPGGISDGQKAAAIVQFALQDIMVLGLPASAEPVPGTNDIGIAGGAGFAVGICPALPAGYAEMAGTLTPGSDNYGNYQYSDGSIQVWIPAFFVKIGSGSNGLDVNIYDIKPYSAYADVAAANAAGYSLPRMFYDNGATQLGVFVDKYGCSNNGGIASSIPMASPLSTYSGRNPLSDLDGAPEDNFAGCIAAAKTRGEKFFCASRFIRAGLALLSVAHGQAATSTASCAWYDPEGLTNYPKGNNNEALGDIDDGTLTFVDDNYYGSGKTGSANVLAKTTHNGQACGVADLNGGMFEVSAGLTSDGTDLYVLKTTVQMSALTGGNTLATDSWGGAGLAENYDNVGSALGVVSGAGGYMQYGNAAQVFSEATSGAGWLATGLGIPMVGGVGGTNVYGMDGFFDSALVDELCPISGGDWGVGAVAGVWTLGLYAVRGGSSRYVGFRAASYL